MRSRLKSTALSVTFLLASVACGVQAPVAPTIASAVSGGPAAGVVDAEIKLCHAEGGVYYSIAVSPNAETEHRNHGDGKVGDFVPASSTLTFDAYCRPAGAAIDIESLLNGEAGGTLPAIAVETGDQMTWTSRITNVGTLTLSGITVMDDAGQEASCSTATLPAGATMTCTTTGEVAAGPHTRSEVVSAEWTTTTGSGSVSDSYRSFYVGVTND